MHAPVILAEVMDKEPTLAWIWTTFLVLALLGSALSLVNRWLALLVLPITCFFAWATLDELQDPFLGPAILDEAGRGYVVQCNLAIAGALAAPSIVLLAKCRRWTVTGLLIGVAAAALGLVVLRLLGARTTASIFCGTWLVALVALLIGSEASRYAVRRT
jgi:hypothetical protein